MKKIRLLRSAAICLVVAVVLAAGLFLFTGEEAVFVNSKVEADLNGHSGALNFEAASEASAETAETAQEQIKAEGESETEEPAVVSGDEEEGSSDEEEKEEQAPEEKADQEENEQTDLAKPDQEEDKQAAEETSNQTEEIENSKEQNLSDEIPVIQTQGLEAEAEQKEPEAETEAEVTVEADQTAVEPAPVVQVSYSWGGARNFTFRTEVTLTNNGSSTSENVRVSVPLLENRSPYQTTTLRSVNYNVVSTSGRVSTFNLGNLAPGETKTIVADFDVALRTVSLNSSNETIEKARQAFEQYKGSVNCRTLALGFISKSRELGIEAREVIGYARPEHGPMTAGSLAGARHSWAEFYVDGLGWVPVDLTFKYFGEFPHHSHVVESYSDESIQVNFNGGNLSATWSNAIY